MIILTEQKEMKFKITMNKDAFRDGVSGNTTFTRPDVHGMDVSPEDEKKILSILDDLESAVKGASVKFVGAKSKNKYEITRVN
jgi:hypothetical protein